MFIILGSPRSGTTLLATTLDQNTQIAVPHETDFIIPAAFLCSRIEDEHVGREAILTTMLNSGLRYSIQEYLTPEEIEAVVNESAYDCASLISSVYDAVAQKAGAMIAGDKSPNDILTYQIFEKTGLFSSNIKFIHIVRDIRDVMLSLSKMPWAPARLERYYPRLWNDSNLSSHRLLEDAPDRYRLVRYEDLVADPEPIVRALTEFLGVPFEPAMLNHESRGVRYRDCGYHANLSRPINTDPVNKWATELPADVQHQCEVQASEALAHFGYL